MDKIKLDSIQASIEDIKQGKVIIVVDDENRENEGDFLCAAQGITDTIVNFMVTQGRGLVCVPLTEPRCDALDLHMMAKTNTDPKGTAFTVSVDLIGQGVSTGISAQDRAKTIKALANEEVTALDFSRPGHIFPLKAKEGGVLHRAGHTEAAIDFARLAGLNPVGVIVEIMNEDGSMARLPELRKIADKWNLKLVSIEDLIAYRLKNESSIQLIEDFPVQTIYGDFRLKAFEQKDNHQLHFALVYGQWSPEEAVPVRVKASNNYYDLFSVLIKGERNQFEKVAQRIKEEGKGVIVIINNVHHANQILNRLSQFKYHQTHTADYAVLDLDEKEYGIGAQIIQQLKIQNLRVISNNIKSLSAIEGYGIQVVDYIKL